MTFKTHFQMSHSSLLHIIDFTISTYNTQTHMPEGLQLTSRSYPSDCGYELCKILTPDIALKIMRDMPSDLVECEQPDGRLA